MILLLLSFLAGLLIPDPWTLFRVWRARARIWTATRSLTSIAAAMAHYLIESTFAIDRLGATLLRQVQVARFWAPVIGLQVQRHPERTVIYLVRGKR